MPPRRPRASPNASFSKSRQNDNKSVPPSTVLPSPAPAGRAMSPTSTYNHNLRSVRRRDPTIVSIFDKFDHVCVYVLQSGKWEKAGYEGAAFLFEREHEPRYGLYILNRSGPEDYVQYIYPEDDLTLAAPTLLSYRIYPDYTAKRFATPKSSAEGQHTTATAPWMDGRSPDPHAEKHKIGSPRTLGFWIILDKDGQNPLKDALIRLHACVANGKRYPNEYRKAPDRPLSTKPHDLPDTSTLVATSYQAGPTQPITSSQSVTSSLSELDVLFAKLAPTSSGGAAALVQAAGSASVLVPAQAPAVPPPPPSAPKTSVDTLFASLIPSQAQKSKPRASLVSPASHAIEPNGTPTQGLALLDSIFASAHPTGAPPPTQPPFTHPPPAGEMNASFRFPRPPGHQHHQAASRSPEILSPKPTASALPPVLNMAGGALASLMGHPHSRGSSVAGSSSSSGVGGHYQGNSQESTPPVADPLLRFNERADALTALTSRTLRAPREPQTGDATPRARMPALAADVSTSSSALGKSGASFEDSSVLWPGGDALASGAGALDMDGVVELDFVDTAALRDPAIFSARAAKGKGRGRGAPQSPPAPTAAHVPPEKGKRKGKKDVASSNGGMAQAPVANGAQKTDGIQAGHRPRRSLVVEADDDDELAANGHAASSTPAAGLVEAANVRPALLDALFASQASVNAKADISREVFVREVVRLMNTDKAFVDQLWQGYLGRRVRP